MHQRRRYDCCACARHGSCPPRQGGLDFQALLNKHPDTVLEVIIHHGTKLLGTFEVKVSKKQARILWLGCHNLLH